MICESCAHRAPVLKTVRWRTGGERKFALCDDCYAPLAASLWIVRGHHDANGKCDSCDYWYSLNDLAVVRMGGGKRYDFGGLCRSCVRQ